MAKSKKMERKLVASKDNKGSEVHFIAKKFSIPTKVVREVMMKVSGTGKPCRSRVMIYAGLRALGYVIPPKTQ